ncbi:expressed hypothetical protein [Trichoplax adhaerens]|uniref:IGFBP N-terminal domain-containing protein n=1 Tax=Trichoplax adhaerens TaxID=10228 RepID=B3SCG1_TRIAD|nr:expressed hypothetical protein [Trichoplax adhaerens]EDV19610.1 expressed hypothetical protein [Trichoplax adhaerens]|eukprot:XP_002117943.1 expressed hypothetical protein [Trichoplax adhaerens]
MKFLFLSLALASAVSLCWATTCPQCEIIRCPRPDCEEPIASDFCGCCQTCVKNENQICAIGMSPVGQGVCREGLFCAHRKDDGSVLPFQTAIDNPIIGETFRRLPQLNFTCMQEILIQIWTARDLKFLVVHASAELAVFLQNFDPKILMVLTSEN